MVNDYFKGLEMSALNADRFTITNIDPKVIKEDLDLLDHKFWDYKMWHPAVATMYFVHRYHVIAEKVIEREIGTKQSEGYRKMASRYDLRKMPLRTIRAFWKARMHADAIGCTYDVYIRASIRNFRANHKLYATVKASGGKQVMPYANQLTNKFVIDQAILDWSAEKKARFPMPKHADIVNNPDLWFRPEMEKWLEEEATKTGFKDSLLRMAKKQGLILEPNQPSV